MVKKFSLLTAILAGFMTTDLSAIDKLEAVTEENQPVISQTTQPLYIVEKLKAPELYHEILSYLSAKEALRLSLSSKDLLAKIKECTGLYFSNMSFDDYFPLFKKLVITPHPHMNRNTRFASALLSHFRGNGRFYAFTKWLIDHKSLEVSQSRNNRFCLLPEFLSKYSKNGIKSFYTNILKSSDPDIDILTELFKTNLHIVKAIDQNFLDSLPVDPVTNQPTPHVQSFKDAVMPYLRFYTRMINWENPFYKRISSLIGSANQSDDMKAFGALMVAQNPDTDVSDKFDLLELLSELGMYKDESAQVYWSIAQGIDINDTLFFNASDRLNALKHLNKFKGIDKDQIAQTYLSIAQDLSVDPSDRLHALEILNKFEGIDKDQIAQTYLSIAQCVGFKTMYRLRAIKNLVQLGMYKDQAKQVCLSIAQCADIHVSDKLDALKILNKFEEIDKDQIVQACLSIVRNKDVFYSFRFNALEILVQLGEKYKNQIVEACLSIITSKLSNDPDEPLTNSIEILSQHALEYKDQAKTAYSYIEKIKTINFRSRDHLIKKYSWLKTI